MSVQIQACQQMEKPLRNKRKSEDPGENKDDNDENMDIQIKILNN